MGIVGNLWQSNLQHLHGHWLLAVLVVVRSLSKLNNSKMYVWWAV